MFGRKSEPPPEREELVRKLDSIRPDGSSDRPMAPEDVTGVLDLALERLRAAQQETHDVLTIATERLLEATNATVRLTRALSDPPKKSG